jgi:hypothetical protein
MRYIQHPSNNTIFGAPKGVPAEECSALPVTKGYDGNGRPTIRSYWRPDAQELAAINAGKPIILELWGTTLVPILLLVDGAYE